MDLPALARPLPSIAGRLGWDSDMHQGTRKDTMLMDMKNLQQFKTDGISANDHIRAMKKGCTDGRSREQLRKPFHGREGEITRGSSCRRGNRVFLGLRQEFLLSGFSEEEEKG